MSAPKFADPDVARRWHDAHRAALDHVLALVAGQRWSSGLVLRGSMLLTAWLGEAARPPADLDWVVVDDRFPEMEEFLAGDLSDMVEIFPEMEYGEEIRRADLLDAVADRLDDVVPAGPYGDLLDHVARSPTAAGGVVLDAAEALIDSDWAASNYLGAGVRLLIPWRAPGSLSGCVQLDFAVEESLPESPTAFPVPRGDSGAPPVVRAVSRELSLAWKLLWMDQDADAGGVCGKDLYDAVLLAESCQWPQVEPLLRVCAGSYPGGSQNGLDNQKITPGGIVGWPVEWDQFRADHPWVVGTARDWLARLATFRAGT